MGSRSRVLLWEAVVSGRVLLLFGVEAKSGLLGEDMGSKEILGFSGCLDGEITS